MPSERDGWAEERLREGGRRAREWWGEMKKGKEVHAQDTLRLTLGEYSEFPCPALIFACPVLCSWGFVLVCMGRDAPFRTDPRI